MKSAFGAVLLLLAGTGKASEAVTDSVPAVPEAADEVDVAYIAPALEIFAANLGMAAVNKYVRGVQYAHIDEGTIWHNLTGEWVWDDNNFEVNQIGHPVQGGMYYSIARANGHGYLGGLAYTTFGSIQWEYFMETEPPALNDLVTTRMGGAMIGEVSWRLAEYVSGESTGEKTGWLRKTGAFLVNPVFGMDRLINGTPRRLALSNQASKLLGLRITTSKALGKGLTRSSGLVNAPETQVPLAGTAIRLAHGDPFTATKPFDHFTLNLGLSLLKDPVANVNLRGQLWQTSPLEGKSSRSILQVTQNYDYLNSTIYRLSANSFGAEWLTQAHLGEEWLLRARVQPIFIALGAASTEYYLKVERDYNFGIGSGWKTALSLHKPGFGSFTASSDRYWIRTQSGAKGDEVIDIHSFELQKDLYKALGAGLGYHIYDRIGNYEDYPRVSILNQEFRLLATLTL